MNGPAGTEPIILVGTGRCGSTLLHRLLALHDDLGWLSTHNEVFPSQTWLSVSSNLYRLPLPRRLKLARAFPKPFEAYRFWEHYLPGFSRRDRAPGGADVPAAGIGPVREATARVVRYQRRRRLLVKVTGWSRIAYFDRIYPEARFVSLRRDPRSVISSWVEAGWLDVTSAPGSPQWQWGEVRPSLKSLWQRLGGDALLSVALKIRLDLEDIATDARLLPERCYELWYEDLITEPRDSLESLVQFADLEWTPGFERAVAGTRFYDSRDTWRRHLREEDGKRVLAFLREADQLDDSPVRVGPWAAP